MAKGKKVGEVENEGTEIREKIKGHITGVETEHWALSSLLWEVYSGTMYTGWGFSSWKEYVEKELDFQLRKAEYHTAVGKWFSRMPSAAQEWARGLGFSKVRLLTGIVTPENIAEWKGKIEGKSFLEIQAIIKGGGEEDDGDTGESKGKENKLKNVNLKQFPEQHANFIAATDIAKGMAESDKISHAVDLIMTDFLATNGGIETVQDYLKKVEKATGVRLVGYDPSENAVVYGGALIHELRQLKIG